MKKIFLLLSLIVLLQGVCSAKETIVKFKYPNQNVKAVTLIVGASTIEQSLDDTGCTEFKLKDARTGYVTLQVGYSQMKLFIKRGTTLSVGYVKNDDKSRAIPFYEGTLSEENRFISQKESYKKADFRNCSTPQEVMKLLNETVDENLKIIEAQPFSKDFIKMERERVRYQTLLEYNSYQRWNPTLFPYLKEKMVQNDKLLAIDEYCKFMKEALSTRGFENMPTYDIYKHTDEQLSIITSEIKNQRIKEYLMVTVLSDYINRQGLESMEKFDAIYKKNVNEGIYKNRYDALYAQWAKTAKGEPCPAFQFEGVDGKTYSIEDFKGKYLFIDCWATWCGPCMAQVKPLQALEHEFANRNIVFVGISSDKDKAKWMKCVKDKNMGGVQLFQGDNGEQFNREFMISSIPRFILVDKEGRIISANMSKPSEPATKKRIESLIGL